MSISHPGPRLFGRSRECAALDGLLASVHSGRSSVLVLRGEAGSGKTALREYISERASGRRVLRVGGVESEMELAYAGLHQLCTPIRDRLERLPIRLRDALRVALALSDGVAPDRFMVGLALLSLLSEVAQEGPLVCLVDDAQWVDLVSLQCLAFVARRLVAEPVLLVFSVREPSVERELLGLPELAVTGLADRDARLLVASAVRGRLDEQIRDRIVAETRGNPLALLELYRG